MVRVFVASGGGLPLEDASPAARRIAGRRRDGRLPLRTYRAVRHATVVSTLRFYLDLALISKKFPVCTEDCWIGFAFGHSCWVLLPGG